MSSCKVVPNFSVQLSPGIRRFKKDGSCDQVIKASSLLKRWDFQHIAPIATLTFWAPPRFLHMLLQVRCFLGFFCPAYCSRHLCWIRCHSKNFFHVFNHWYDLEVTSNMVLLGGVFLCVASEGSSITWQLFCYHATMPLNKSKVGHLIQNIVRCHVQDVQYIFLSSFYPKHSWEAYTISSTSASCREILRHPSYN